MAVYTDITDAELSAFLADFDLGRLRACKGIAEGVENSNFLVDTDRGRYILTIYERRVKADELPFFLGLMRHLSANGFPCPVPQSDRSGLMLKTIRGKAATLVSFLSGFSVRQPTAAHCREAGAGLAQLHMATSGFELSRFNNLGHTSWAALFAPLGAEAEGFQPGLSELIRQDLAALAQGWPDTLPGGVIHADFFPDNVFFIEKAFVAAFDFYFACNDAFAYDLAICLNAWCHAPDGTLDLERGSAMIAGYESRRPLSSAEKSAMPMLARGAAMRFFLTRLTDWGSTPAGALVKPHDPMEYARKLAFHRTAAGNPAAYGLGL
jgi:homoserine kinase type II